MVMVPLVAWQLEEARVVLQVVAVVVVVELLAERP